MYKSVVNLQQDSLWEKAFKFREDTNTTSNLILKKFYMIAKVKLIYIYNNPQVLRSMNNFNW